jgi:hypothetical protein
MSKKTWRERMAERAAEFREDLKNGAVLARDDIRQKLVEEPWFGRAVTPQHQISHDVDYTEQLGWRKPRDPKQEMRDELAEEQTQTQDRRGIHGERRQAKDLGWQIERTPEQRAEIDRQMALELERDQDVER